MTTPTTDKTPTADKTPTPTTTKDRIAEARSIVLRYANDLNSVAVRESGGGGGSSGGPFDANSYRLVDAIRPCEAFDSAKIAEADRELTETAGLLSLPETLTILEFVDQLGVPAVAGPFVERAHSIIASLPSDSRQLDVLRGGTVNEPAPLDWSAAVAEDKSGALAQQLEVVQHELGVAASEKHVVVEPAVEEATESAEEKD